MGKRFRDTGIWDKPWFRKLSPSDKLAWNYVCDRCDAVGVWVPDFDAGTFYIGQAVDWEGLPDKTNGNIEIREDGKWWVVDFCNFQYGKINAQSESKVQKNLYKLLFQHGLWDEYLSTEKSTKRSSFRRKQVTPELRANVLKRDEYKCQYCGMDGDEKTLEADHVFPASLGGMSDEENLVASCNKCNTRKGDRPVASFLLKWELASRCSKRILDLIEKSYYSLTV